MAYIYERRKELLHTVEKLQREQFEKSIRSLEKLYAGEEHRRKVVETFAGLVRQWEEQNEGTRKAASLGICYLYSSILRKDYKFRLVLMGEEFWLDGESIEADWELSDFFSYFENDMEIVIEKLRGMFVRLCSAEEDAVRQWCAEYYLAAISKLCTDMAGELAEGMGLEGMEKTEEFCFFFGHYQGDGEIIWRNKKEEM